MRSLSILLTLLFAARTFAADAAAEARFFEARIRPVLVEHCYQCHSTSAGKSEGGLRVDSRSAIRKGGDGGPAVVPGDPAASRLLAAIAHLDPNLEMPLNKPRLPKPVLADVESWIRRGAVDPRDEPDAGAERPPTDLESGRRFWAFRKPVRAPLPTVSDPAWPRRDLDRFVLAKLDAAGLSPSDDADPATLLRRLHFDLIGLPPSPEERAEFEAATRRDVDRAIATVVDRLLASPRFGERWGKHWLDVARFAESSGRESNLTFPHAWRYRDYVIDAFDADVPFDRFVVEQIAGDLLPAQDDAERARLLVATGFLALGPKGLNEMNPQQFAADLVDEQIDAMSRAVLATSVACARCHDHKSDPFPMRDYYALAGIFASTKTSFGSAIGVESNVDSDLVRLPELPGQLVPGKSVTAAHVAFRKKQLAELNQREKDGTAAARQAAADGKNPDDYFTFAEALRIYWTRGGIVGELRNYDETGRALPLCMGVSDRDDIADAPRLERGEIAHPRETIPRGFPRVIDLAGAKPPPLDRSGRLELAQWLTHPDQPLTPRVYVNRVWRHLFGAGLVRTVDNFGFSGERPSHPELLDRLAVDFVERGWSTKSLIREIVASRTYRQSSNHRPDGFAKDPENRLAWRASKRRIDAEAIRDAMLAVSGRLDPARRPGSLIAEIGDKSVSLFGFAKEIPSDLDCSRHRSVYLPVVRDRLPDALDLFDAADPSFVTGDRDVTNVPLQALYLMNAPFVQEQAAALADRVMKEATGRDERTRRAFALCFGRDPDAIEARLAARFVRATNDDPQRDRRRLTDYCQALLCLAEFRNLD